MMADWTWPQIIVAGWLIFNLVATILLHGKPREPWNIGYTAGDVITMALLLRWGGFWN